MNLRGDFFGVLVGVLVGVFFGGTKLEACFVGVLEVLALKDVVILDFEVFTLTLAELQPNIDRIEIEAKRCLAAN